MISKELLSEVMLTIHIIDSVNAFGRDVFWVGRNSQGGRIDGSINIHELAHKVKEWANIQNGLYYYIKSHIITDRRSEAHVETYGQSSKKTFEDNTEPEAIFKAGQWILENK